MIIFIFMLFDQLFQIGLFHIYIYIFGRFWVPKTKSNSVPSLTAQKTEYQFYVYLREMHLCK